MRPTPVYLPLFVCITLWVPIVFVCLSCVWLCSFPSVYNVLLLESAVSLNVDLDCLCLLWEVLAFVYATFLLNQPHLFVVSGNDLSTYHTLQDTIQH